MPKGKLEKKIWIITIIILILPINLIFGIFIWLFSDYSLKEIFTVKYVEK